MFNKKGKIVHKELSYKMVGVLFDVYNELGYGHPERYYYKAIEKGFLDFGIRYKNQVCYKLTYRGSEIGRYFLDYLVEDKIILEIKKNKYFTKKDIEQIKKYLEATKLKLAILINITPSGIKFLRIINIEQHNS